MLAVYIALGLLAAFVIFKFILPVFTAAATPPKLMTQAVLRNELRKLGMGADVIDDATLEEVAQFVVNCAKGASIDGRETFHEALYKMNNIMPRAIKGYVDGSHSSADPFPVFEILKKYGIKPARQSTADTLAALGELMEQYPTALNRDGTASGTETRGQVGDQRGVEAASEDARFVTLRIECRQ